jgi:glycosyltransferase involved in cell wall biosynthesis
MTGIAVFAHDEESTLEACIRSLDAGGLGPDDEVHILVNGSTDRTLQIARTLAGSDRRIRPHSLPIADKCNAWNTYIHTLADAGKRMHVFLDADVTVVPGSLSALRRALDAAPQALAAAATPRDGRAAKTWASRILSEHGLAGNLYALSSVTLHRLRDEAIALPFGAIGDDSILLWLLRRDLRPQEEPRKCLIQPVAAAGFAYSSFPFHTMEGLASHLRRQRRYALRDFQVRLLTEHLRRGGRMPRFIGELYQDASIWTQLRAPFGFLPFRLRKLFFLHTWLATRRVVAPQHMHMWDALAPAEDGA